MTGEFEILPDLPELDDETKRLLAEIDRLVEVPTASEPDPGPLGPERIMFISGEPLPIIRQHACDAMRGREVSGTARWLHFYRADRTAGLFALFHAFTAPGEIELVVFGNRGMLKRTVLCFLARTAFRDLGLRRVVARIRADDRVNQDLVRRAGFLHEGTAHAFYADGSDASVWAMTADRCRWLIATPPIAAPPVTLDFTPPIGSQVH